MSQEEHCRGILWQNHSTSKLHYETDIENWGRTIVPKARHLGITHSTFHPDGGQLHKVVRGDNAFVIISGGTFAENFHDKPNNSRTEIGHGILNKQIQENHTIYESQISQPSHKFFLFHPSPKDPKNNKQHTFDFHVTISLIYHPYVSIKFKHQEYLS